jgi:hypothetical protein
MASSDTNLLRSERPAKLDLGSEHDHQKALFEWIRLRARSDSRFLNIFAVPNGFRGDRDQRKAAEASRWLKDEGMEPGVPDIFVAMPVYRRSQIDYSPELVPGLFIEMKAPYRKPKTARGKGGVEPDQAEWHERLTEAGYKVAVCYSCDEARDVICRYFGMERE